MKSFALAAALFAGLSAAQDLSAINNLPACGKLCISNMLAKATTSEFNCKSETDYPCLCKNANFGYGVRDCTAAICSPADMATVVQFGESFCAAAISAGSGSGTASGVATVTTTATAGTATYVVSTGTDSTGGTFTTTLGLLGSTSVTGVTATLTATDSTGSVFTSTATITGGISPPTPASNGTLSGNGTSGSGNSTASVVTGLATLTETNSAGSTFTTTSKTTGTETAGHASSATASSTSTSKAGAAHFAAPGVVGGLAGLLLAIL